jgi:hypothetical protein
MFGLPGGSAGPDAKTGCLGLFIVGMASLAVAALLLGLLLYATRDLGVTP